LKEVVSRSIFLCMNAQYQMQAYMLGAPSPLRPGEVKLAGMVNVMPTVITRTWEYWTRRLEMSGGWPLKPSAKAADDARPKPDAAEAAAESKKRR